MTIKRTKEQRRRERAASRLFRKLVTNDSFREKYLHEWLEKLPEPEGVKEGEGDGRASG